MNREVYQLIKQEHNQKNTEMRRKTLFNNGIDKHRNIRQSQRLNKPGYKSIISDKVKSQIIVDYHLMQTPFNDNVDQYPYYHTLHKLTTLIIKYINTSSTTDRITEIYVGDVPDNLAIYFKELHGKHSDVTVTFPFAKHRFRAQYLFEILQGKRRADKYCTWINDSNSVKQESVENTVSQNPPFLNVSKNFSPEDIFNRFNFKHYTLSNNDCENKSQLTELIPIQDLANSNVYVFYINNIV